MSRDEEPRPEGHAELSLLASVATEFEAQTKAAALRAEGIDAVVTPYGPGGGGPGCLAPAPRGATVWVHRDELDRARALLETLRAEADRDRDAGGEDGDGDAPARPARMPRVVQAGLIVGLAVLLLSLVWTIVVLVW